MMTPHLVKSGINIYLYIRLTAVLERMTDLSMVDECTCVYKESFYRPEKQNGKRWWFKVTIGWGGEKNKRNGKKKKNSQKEGQNQIHKQTVY